MQTSRSPALPNHLEFSKTLGVCAGVIRLPFMSSLSEHKLEKGQIFFKFWSNLYGLVTCWSNADLWKWPHGHSCPHYGQVQFFSSNLPLGMIPNWKWVFQLKSDYNCLHRNKVIRLSLSTGGIKFYRVSTWTQQKVYILIIKIECERKTHFWRWNGTRFGHVTRASKKNNWSLNRESWRGIKSTLAHVCIESYLMPCGWKNFLLLQMMTGVRARVFSLHAKQLTSTTTAKQ